MLATTGEVVPRGADWTHEVKWDGMRVLVEVRAGRVTVSARTGNDVSAAYPELQVLAALGHDVLLDGEVVALADGVPSFSALADRMHVRDPVRAARMVASNPVTLIAFDLLELDDRPLVTLPLRARRELLLGLELGAPETPGVMVPPTYDDGATLLAAAEQQGLEGIVSKRLSSAYRPGMRSRDWLKFPIRPTGSFVVGGYRRERGSSGDRIGAVLVGLPGPDGLLFRGRVGSGLAGRAGQRLRELLTPVDASPFAEALPRVDAEETIWVAPEVVIDVQYLLLTEDGRLRQPAYRGVRTDLSPADLAEEDA